MRLTDPVPTKVTIKGRPHFKGDETVSISNRQRLNLRKYLGLLRLPLVPDVVQQNLDEALRWSKGKQLRSGRRFGPGILLQDVESGLWVM